MPATYVPIECSYELMARIIRAVALQRGGRLNGLPGGELEVEKLADERVEQAGKAREISLYALKGLFEAPYYIWMTRQPELVLFAAIQPGGLQLIDTGWESEVSKLENRQVEVDESLLKKLAVKLSHRVPDPILIRNARVFDSEHATLGPAKDVYVNRRRIAAIYDAGSPVQGTPTVLDAGGRTLMPGDHDWPTDCAGRLH